jgi:hypothetical protein
MSDFYIPPSQPRYIQRMRTRGWRMPRNTINCTRPGRYGNKYYPGCGLGFGNIIDGRPYSWPLETASDAVRHFREHMRLMERDQPQEFAEYLAPLRGKNLACWCSPGEPCHVADVLLPLANRPEKPKTQDVGLCV